MNIVEKLWALYEVSASFKFQQKVVQPTQVVHV